MCSSIPVDKRLVYFPFSLLEKQKDASWILNSKAVSEFLQQYKHSPVLFRNCFPDLFFAITPEELAGLACEDGFVSRIVQLCHPSSKEDKVWKVSWGPFSEESFENFPERNATLLVNDVERYRLLLLGRWQQVIYTCIRIELFLKWRSCWDIFVSFPTTD